MSDEEDLAYANHDVLQGIELSLDEVVRELEKMNVFLDTIGRLLVAQSTYFGA